MTNVLPTLILLLLSSFPGVLFYWAVFSSYGTHRFPNFMSMCYFPLVFLTSATHFASLFLTLQNSKLRACYRVCMFPTLLLHKDIKINENKRWYQPVFCISNSRVYHILETIQACLTSEKLYILRL